jgi:Trypsin-like peptidase domain/SEC-C motif
MKQGRNSLCSCGSGRKFKHCHGRIAGAAMSDEWTRNNPDTKFAVERVGRRKAPEGHRIRFGRGRLALPTANGTFHGPDLGDLGGALMMVGGFDGKRLSTPIGTGIMLAPGIAVTAEHVLQDIRAAGLSVEALAPGFGGSITWWRAAHFSNMRFVDKLTGDVRSRYDLSAMSLEPVSDLGSELVVPLLVASLEPPAIDERVMVLGFQADEDAPNEVGLVVSTGRVAAQHLEGRDRAMLPNPCLELELDIWGGMSGGPVINVHGELIGVASSSVSAISKVSFASLLGPITEYRLTIPWPDGWYQAKDITVGQALADLNQRMPPPARQTQLRSLKLDFAFNLDTVRRAS